MWFCDSQRRPPESVRKGLAFQSSCTKSAASKTLAVALLPPAPPYAARSYQLDEIAVEPERVSVDVDEMSALAEAISVDVDDMSALAEAISADADGMSALADAISVDADGMSALAEPIGVDADEVSARVVELGESTSSNIFFWQKSIPRFP